MGFRFRKTLRIARGLRLNIAKRGASVSMGGRGMTVNVGKKGARGTVGLPGSGMSYSHYSPWKAQTLVWVVIFGLAVAAYYYSR